MSDTDDDSLWSDFTHTRTSPPPEWRKTTLPLEIVERIFHLFFSENHTFADIRPFAMASTQFRTVALRRYMTDLRLHSVNQLVSHTLIHYSIASRTSPHSRVGFGWVKCVQRAYMRNILIASRSLSTTSMALSSSRWQPELFLNLRSLHVSLSTVGSLTQNRVVGQILEPLGSLSLSRMTSLKFTSLWHIDVPLIRMVARLFPMLTTLHLSCSESLDVSCCWICFEASSLAVTHSPIPNHYVNVSTLTVSISIPLS